MINIYGVSFKNDGKIYYFKSDKFTCPINVTVIVDTEKGLQFGKVVNNVNDKSIDISVVKDIIRISTKADYEQYLKNLKDSKDVMLYSKELVSKLKLDMNIIDSSYTFDRKQLLISFIADHRIDFRELAKELASKYKTRIELHQMGARDKAKSVGGVGICGRQLCCRGILNKVQTVTMNMAKDQNIALNPSKINGCCGRLLCCLAYEDDNYLECLHGMPEVGQRISTSFGEGYVTSLDILNRKYKVNINNEIKEIEIDKK